MQKRDCGIILISEGQYSWIFEILLRGGVIVCIKQYTDIDPQRSMMFPQYTLKLKQY